jgi:serine/threonine protein kinase
MRASGSSGAGGMVVNEVPGEGGFLNEIVTAFGTGSRIAGYRLEEQIGAGGMAVVFRARDERLDRLVALKMLAPALAADTAFRQRFIRESRAAAKVDDPHIIPVFEASEANGVLFIAMRYVPGGDVRSLMTREGRLSVGRVAAIISPVASALDAAHAAGLVHRDVKPANMLVDARPGRPDHVYLSDFGLSKGAMSSVGLTGTGQFLGTLDYISPEQIEGLAVDGRADQYALACATFELLTGAPPFPRAEATAVIWAHMSKPPPPVTSRRPDLPPAVDQVLARALAKSPADRFGTCREFADALRTALRLPHYDASPRSVPLEDRRPTEVASPGSGPAVSAIPAAAATVGADLQARDMGTSHPSATGPGPVRFRQEAGDAHGPQSVRRPRRFLPWVAAAVVVLLAAGGLAAAKYVHFGKPGSGGQPVAGASSPAASAGSSTPGRSSTAAPRPSPITSKAAKPLVTSPTKAQLFAENAVGPCLQTAWANAGYPNVFDQYTGNGVDQFSTGTLSDPTGNTAERTLISVRVYANGSVSDNPALDYWGCHPFRNNAASRLRAGDLSCEVIGGVSPEYTVYAEAHSGRVYVRSVQVSFYDSSPNDAYSPVQISPDVMVTPSHPLILQRPVPSVDVGAAAQPNGCTASPGD